MQQLEMWNLPSGKCVRCGKKLTIRTSKKRSYGSFCDRLVNGIKTRIGKTSIEWATHGWSPVIGCLSGCHYCYANGLVRRFGASWLEKEVVYRKKKGIDYSGMKEAVEAFKPVIMHHRLDPITPEKPSNIFFSPLSDPEYWPGDILNIIYEVIRSNQEHIFMILTKEGSIYNKWPDLDNLAFGYTATDGESMKRQVLNRIEGDKKKTFISLEPLHSHMFLIPELKKFDWVIIGAETGKRKGKVVPKVNWLMDIRKYCCENKIPIFEKKSLSKIMGDELLKQFPWWYNGARFPTGAARRIF